MRADKGSIVVGGLLAFMSKGVKRWGFVQCMQMNSSVNRTRSLHFLRVPQVSPNGGLRPEGAVGPGGRSESITFPLQWETDGEMGGHVLLRRGKCGRANDAAPRLQGNQRGGWMSAAGAGRGWTRVQPGLFLSLPLGMTAVVGATGRSETKEDSFVLPLSFFGFILALSLRCSPLGMV